MPKPIEPIEIKEPPLQEIQKKKSCVRRGCSTGCVGLFILIIGIFFVIRFTAIPKPKEFRAVPSHFPSSIPVYDKDAISRITVISGKKKERMFETALYIPRILLSPLLNNTAEQEPSLPSSWNDLLRIIDHPVADNRDTVHIQWKQFKAEPQFIEQYYLTNLRKTGFTVFVSTSTDAHLLSFGKDDIEGTFAITDNPAEPGTDAASLIVHIPMASGTQH